MVRRILESHGTDSERVTLALSRQGLIRPSTTQGHIGDITRTDIVFDAPSAQGGSGGPVFNKYGQVIAVEYAVLQKFGGNSFGIPIAYARELLAASPARGAWLPPAWRRSCQGRAWWQILAHGTDSERVTDALGLQADPALDDAGAHRRHHRPTSCSTPPARRAAAAVPSSTSSGR